MKNKYLFFFFIFLLTSCKSLVELTGRGLVDNKVTRNTKSTYKQIKKIPKKGFYIGHQDTSAYGVEWSHDNNSNENSDIYRLTKKYPAIYGFDIGDLELGYSKNLDGVSFDLMRKLIKQAHANGSLVTLSWHANNPLTNGNSWDKTPAVSSVLSSGEIHDKFDTWIERLAIFFKSLTWNGKSIPLIFRPYHEMSGSWFWWGNTNCSPEEYIQLWRETVNKLRDVHGVHNLIYVYSPDKITTSKQYLEFYPGDEYVDVLGIDVYDGNLHPYFDKFLEPGLSVITELSRLKNKPIALTETGLERIPKPKWFTEKLLPAIENTPISWVLFWRNHDKSHHYIPYPMHAAANDFIEFSNHPKTLFRDE